MTHHNSKKEILFDSIKQIMDEEDVFGLNIEYIARRAHNFTQAYKLGITNKKLYACISDPLLKSIIHNNNDIPLDYQNLNPNKMPKEHPFVWEIDDRLQTLAKRMNLNPQHFDFESLKIYMVKNSRLRWENGKDYAATTKDAALSKLMKNFYVPERLTQNLIERLENFCMAEGLKIENYDLTSFIVQMNKSKEIIFDGSKWIYPNISNVDLYALLSQHQIRQTENEQHDAQDKQMCLNLNLFYKTAA